MFDSEMAPSHESKKRSALTKNRELVCSREINFVTSMYRQSFALAGGSMKKGLASYISTIYQSGVDPTFETAVNP